MLKQKWLVLVVSWFLILTPSIQTWAALPDFGSPDATIMSPAQEARFGKAFMRSIWRSQKVISDPLIKHYIESLGHTLVSNSDDAQHHFSFFLIRDPAINAFAGPDGYIGVFSGLLLTAESEDELAAVVAHEIALVTQKHLLRAFSASQKLTIPMAAVLLGAVLLGAASGSSAGLALALGGQAAIQQNQINFTRANEKEADNIGMQLLKRSRFDTHAMPSFFEKLLKANQNYVSELPEFLRSHPITINRISDARARAASYPYQQHDDSLNFKLVQERLRVDQFVKSITALKYYQSRLNKHHSKMNQAHRYGYALVLMSRYQYKKALHEINQLLKKSPLNLFYLSAKAQVLQDSGNSNQAIKFLTDALALFPQNEALSIQLATILNKKRRYQQAYELISELHYQDPTNPLLLQMLANISAKRHYPAQARLYLAEFYYVLGLTDVAIKQLENELRSTQLSDYFKSRLTAKLQEYKKEQIKH